MRKNGIAFYSWKNTDLRQLQLFADNFKWLSVVEFSLTDCPCLLFSLERDESLGLKCSFWRTEIRAGKLLRLFYHCKNYINNVCQSIKIMILPLKPSEYPTCTVFFAQD